MKHILIFTFIALICYTESSFGQVRLSGDMLAPGSTNLLIRYYEGDISKTADVKVTDGKFTWEAPITETQKITMIFPGRTAAWIFVEPGNMTIKGNRDSLATYKVTGSKTNDEAVAYATIIKPLDDERKSLYLNYGKLSADKEVELEEKLAVIAKQKALLTNNYIAAHRESAFSLNLITESCRLGTYEDVMNMYAQLGNKMKSTSEGKRIADRLVILRRSAVGEKMRDFIQNDNNGNPVSFSAFKGKYVLVDFWASWCAPCRAEIPAIIKAYNTFKDHNFTVLSISLDDRKDRWLNAIEALKMPWTQVSDLKGWDNELSVYYGLKAIPASLLIGPDGKIIARDLRGIMLAKKLNELLM